MSKDTSLGIVVYWRETLRPLKHHNQHENLNKGQEPTPELSQSKCGLREGFSSPVQNISWFLNPAESQHERGPPLPPSGADLTCLEAPCWSRGDAGPLIVSLWWPWISKKPPNVNVRLYDHVDFLYRDFLEMFHPRPTKNLYGNFIEKSHVISSNNSL